MTRADDDRIKQIAVGVGILLALMLTVCGLLLGWRYIPGLLGETVGVLVGLATTPVFLETFFVIVGLVLVVTINHWRQKRDGDEFVYLEQGEDASLLVQAREFLLTGDFESAGGQISKISAEELGKPEALALRIELAKATGRESLARQLEDELRLVKNEEG